MWPGRGVDHLSPSSAEVKERVELYLCSPSGPSWPVLGGNLPLPLLLHLPITITYYLLLQLPIITFYYNYLLLPFITIAYYLYIYL